MYVCIYIYIYTYVNGAAAKLMHFDRLGKKVRPGTFVNTKVC